MNLDQRKGDHGARDGKTHEKRHAALASGLFLLLLPALLFVAFFAGILFGILPLACGAPLEELRPYYVVLSLIVTFVGSAWISLRFHRWLRRRCAGERAD